MILKSNSTSSWSVAFKILIVLNVFVIDVFSARHNYKEIEIIDDLLVKTDMETYLGSLEKIALFTKANKFFVDFNLSFGIFMINVNTRSILQLSKRSIVENYKTRFEYLVKITDDILRHFANTILNVDATYDNEDLQQLRDLASLFVASDTAWPVQLPTFNVELLQKTKFFSRKELEDVYYKWPKYLERVHYDRIYGSSLAQSDSCLAALALNPVNHQPKSVHCHVPYTCIESVLNGIDYGYTVPHRELFLLMARFGRGCVLISPEEDQELKDTLCAKMYNEAEYIAQHGYKLPDLMLEIIGIGTIEGHAQFLRRSWLEELLEFQNDVGCFNLTRVNEVNPKDTIYRREGYQFGLKYSSEGSQILGEVCNAHITTVASIMLSSAIRYITEMEKKTQVVNNSLTLPPLTHSITPK